MKRAAAKAERDHGNDDEKKDDAEMAQEFVAILGGAADVHDGAVGQAGQAMVQTMCCSAEGTAEPVGLASGQAAAEMREGGLVLLRRVDELELVVGADDLEKGRFLFPAAFILEWMLERARRRLARYQARQASSLELTISRSISRNSRTRRT